MCGSNRYVGRTGSGGVISVYGRRDVKHLDSLAHAAAEAVRDDNDWD